MRICLSFPLSFVFFVSSWFKELKRTYGGGDDGSGGLHGGG